MKRYELRHMFSHRFGDDRTGTMLTRDNEHLLAKLPDKVLKDAIAKGFVLEHEMTSKQAEALKEQGTETPLAEHVAEQRERVAARKAPPKATTTAKEK